MTIDRVLVPSPLTAADEQEGRGGVQLGDGWQVDGGGGKVSWLLVWQEGDLSPLPDSGLPCDRASIPGPPSPPLSPADAQMGANRPPVSAAGSCTRLWPGLTPWVTPFPGSVCEARSPG